MSQPLVAVLPVILPRRSGLTFASAPSCARTTNRSHLSLVQTFSVRPSKRPSWELKRRWLAEFHTYVGRLRRVYEHQLGRERGDSLPEITSGVIGCVILFVQVRTRLTQSIGEANTDSTGLRLIEKAIQAAPEYSPLKNP